MAELTVESCLKELREMGFDGHNVITVHDCRAKKCRPLAITIEAMGGSSWKAPTLVECMAKVRRWKESQDG